MSDTSAQERRRIQKLDPQSLKQHQLARFNQLVDAILPRNQFYAKKLSGVTLPLERLDQLSGIPFTFKEEVLHGSEAGGFASNLTWDPQRYARFHQTSGTRGRPMVVLDTDEDWQWWIDCWQYVLDSAQITSDDRVLMAFSYGPFIGFWSAHDACLRRGCLVIPGGGLNTLARLELARKSTASVMFCTPSYALHMAEVAAEHQINVAELRVRTIIVAGEPGGSIPEIRQRIETAWDARVVDHSGASEVGPWGQADDRREGIHVIESEFIPEFLSVENGKPAEEGQLAELVLTNLGRAGAPVIRYRTGDLVRPTWQHDRENRFVLLQGGILGRTDDMMVIRGVNIFPTAVEQILRSFPEVIEYRLTARKEGEMDQLSIEIEDRLDQPQRVSEELRLRLSLKVDVRTVPIGSLPRFDGKGKRFIDSRG
jgi:phenylacetate-CoA ligase